VWECCMFIVLLQNTVSVILADQRMLYSLFWKKILKHENT